MLTEAQEEEFKRFESAGNRVIGRPKRIVGKFGFREYKTGSLVVFGENVVVRGGVMRFPLGGGELRIGTNVIYNASTHVGPTSVLSVGSGTRFNRPCEMHAWEGANIKIGKDCLFSNVKIRTSDLHSVYDLHTRERVNRSRSVYIGDVVWVAEGAVIGKGSHIETGSVIGSYSFVTSYIPAACIAIGVPAKVVKTGIYWEKPLDMSDPVALPPKAPKPAVETQDGFVKKTTELVSDMVRRFMVKVSWSISLVMISNDWIEPVIV